MAGNDQGEDKGVGEGKGKEPAVDYFEELTLAPGSNSSSGTAVSNSGTQGSMGDLAFVPTPPVRNLPSCRTSCTVCKKEFECPRMYMSFYVICPYCDDIFLASEKASAPNISSSIDSVDHAANIIPFDYGSKSSFCSSALSSSATMPSVPIGFQATGSNSSSNTAISNSGTRGSIAGVTSIPTPSVGNLPFCRTVYNVCKKEYESEKTYMKSYILCPYCDGVFLASEKASPPNITLQILDQERLAGPISTSFQGYPSSSSARARPLPRVIGGGRPAGRVQPPITRLNSALVHQQTIFTYNTGMQPRPGIWVNPYQWVYTSTLSPPDTQAIVPLHQIPAQYHTYNPQNFTSAVVPNSYRSWAPNERQVQPQGPQREAQVVSLRQREVLALYSAGIYGSNLGVAALLDSPRSMQPMNSSPSAMPNPEQRTLESSSIVQEDQAAARIQEITMTPLLEGPDVNNPPLKDEKMTPVESTDSYNPSTTQRADEFTIREQEAGSQRPFETQLSSEQFGNPLNVEQATTDTKDNSGDFDSENGRTQMAE